MNTTRSTGDDGDRQSMISRKYGVLPVRHRPGSDDARCDSIRCRSAHPETVSSGSGFNPRCQAASIPPAPS